jgi:hypothetical protein
MGIGFGKLGGQQVGGDELQQFGQVAAGAAARLGQNGSRRLVYPFIMDVKMVGQILIQPFLQAAQVAAAAAGFIQVGVAVGGRFIGQRAGPA